MGVGVCPRNLCYIPLIHTRRPYHKVTNRKCSLRIGCFRCGICTSGRKHELGHTTCEQWIQLYPVYVWGVQGGLCQETLIICMAVSIRILPVRIRYFLSNFKEGLYSRVMFSVKRV